MMGYSGASANGNWRLERDWNGRYLRNAVCILVACRWLYTVQCGEMPQQQSLAVDLSIFPATSKWNASMVSTVSL